VLNLILALFLFFTLDLGLNGAPLATHCKLQMCLIVAPLVARKHWMTFDWKDLNVVKRLGVHWSYMGPAMSVSCCRRCLSMLATKLIAGVWYGGQWRLGRWVHDFEFFPIVAVLGVDHVHGRPMIGRCWAEKKIDGHSRCG